MRNENEKRDVKREKRTNSQEEPARVYRPRTLTPKLVKSDNDLGAESKDGDSSSLDDFSASKVESPKRESRIRTATRKDRTEKQGEEKTYRPRSWRRIEEPEAADEDNKPDRNSNSYFTDKTKSRDNEARPRERFSRERDRRRLDRDKNFDRERSSDDHFHRSERSTGKGFFGRDDRRQNSDEHQKPRLRKRSDDDRAKPRFEDKPRLHRQSSGSAYQPRTFQKRRLDDVKSLMHENEQAESSIAAKSNDGLIRLNRYIANSGLCSRREADEYIANGQITVNGQVVTTLGTKVKPDDEVRFKGKLLMSERKVYILLNKPKDYVTTLDDPHAKHTVMELIEGACTERVYPVGRLDRNSTGVLLLTNDGELTTRLTHPSFKKRKIYHVGLDRRVSPDHLQSILDGVELDGEKVQVDAIDYVEGGDGYEVGIEIHSGQNRVVRRIFESLGYKVTKLDRVYFAGLTKKNLPRGKWRFLTQKEINMLKMNRFS